MDYMNANNMKDKKVLVVGLGKSGIAAVQAMLKLGAEVSIQDSKTRNKSGNGFAYYLGTVPADMSEFDMMILSPGVNPELPFVREAEEEGVEIIGELEIAYRIGRGHFIGITGTNGKTTTTTLTGEIFKNSGRYRRGGYLQIPGCGRR